MNTVPLSPAKAVVVDCIRRLASQPAAVTIFADDAKSLLPAALAAAGYRVAAICPDPFVYDFRSQVRAECGGKAGAYNASAGSVKHVRRQVAEHFADASPDCLVVSCSLPAMDWRELVELVGEGGYVVIDAVAEAGLPMPPESFVAGAAMLGLVIIENHSECGVCLMRKPGAVEESSLGGQEGGAAEPSGPDAPDAEPVEAAP